MPIARIPSGVGLGFRRDLAEALLSDLGYKPKFVELAPENWMDIGGFWSKTLHSISERYTLTCHGLSLSLGSPESLDWDFLSKIKTFLKQFNISIYSEHLSYCKCENAHLYDLLPIPFRQDAVKHLVRRIREVQDFLEMRIAIENISYYTEVAPEMDEVRFLTSILNEADCNLLLDVNNVYVNSFNHKYDPYKFIDSLPLQRVSYIHMAGHEKRAEDLIIDTHGKPIIADVFKLFSYATKKLQPVPVLLERDFNFPQYSELAAEMMQLESIMNASWEHQNAA